MIRSSASPSIRPARSLTRAARAKLPSTPSTIKATPSQAKAAVQAPRSTASKASIASTTPLAVKACTLHAAARAPRLAGGGASLIGSSSISASEGPNPPPGLAVPARSLHRRGPDPAPAAAHRLVERDEGVQLVRFGLDQGQLGIEQVSLRIELLEVRRIAGLVAVAG